MWILRYAQYDKKHKLDKNTKNAQRIKYLNKNKDKILNKIKDKI